MTGIVLVLAIVAAAMSMAAELDLDKIDLPRGFVIDEYANVPNARSLACARSSSRTR